MNKLLTTTALAAAVAFLAGCSGPVSTPASDPPGAVVVTPKAPAAPSPEDLASYFGAIANGSPSEQRTAADELAAPGSNAYAYAIEQAAVNQAFLDSGMGSSPPSELNTLDDGFEMCSTDLLTQEETCNVFDNLAFVDGQLADFDAGGTPLAGRLTLGDGSSVPLGDFANATLIAAYTSIAGNLYVVFEIKSNIDGFSAAYDSTYLAPDGRQANVTQTIGPSKLAAGALANYALVFEGAAFGGTLNLGGFNANFDRVSASIPIA